MKEVDVFVLDWERRKVALLENFTSLIWTDRHRTWGDFKLVLPTPEIDYNASSIYPGRFLHIEESNRLMIIETVEKTQDSAGQDKIEVKGRSYEVILDERAVVMNAAGTPYKSTGAPGIIATRLVRAICVDGEGFSANDVIPGLSVRGPSPATTEVSVEIPVKSLYSAVKELCDADDLGMRILFDPDTRGLEFVCLRGTDRTLTGQSHALIFGPDYDNLDNTKFLRSITDYKNVAYVVHDDRNRVIPVFERGRSQRTGFARRVLVVDANDIKDPTTAELEERGYNELAKHNYQSLFDGEIPHDFGGTFGLGDKIELQSPDGFTGEATVEELIWTYDADGWKSYPTFKFPEELST